MLAFSSLVNDYNRILAVVFNVYMQTAHVHSSSRIELVNLSVVESTSSVDVQTWS